jgi:hypothetical protein
LIAPLGSETDRKTLPERGFSTANRASVIFMNEIAFDWQIDLGAGKPSVKFHSSNTRYKPARCGGQKTH